MALTVTQAVFLACCGFVLCGLFANLFVLYVFYRFKTIRHRPSSASLIALTVFDLLMCASTIYLFVHQSLEDPEEGTNVLYCHMMYSAMLVFMLSACMMIVYIAFDRLYATSWPVHFLSKPHLKHTVKASVWSFVLSAMVYSPAVINSTKPLMSNATCGGSTLWPKHFLTFYVIVSEILALLLVVFYCMARYKLYVHNAGFLAECEDPQFSSIHQTKREQEIKMSKSILSTVTPDLFLFSMPCTIMMIGLVIDVSWVMGMAGLMMGSGALINSSINVFVYCWKLPDFKACALECLGRNPPTSSPGSKPLVLYSVSHNVKINNLML